MKAGRILEISGDIVYPETSKMLVKEAVGQWGRLDVFVANAGVLKQAGLLEYVL